MPLNWKHLPYKDYRSLAIVDLDKDGTNGGTLYRVTVTVDVRLVELINNKELVDKRVYDAIDKALRNII